MKTVRWGLAAAFALVLAAGPVAHAADDAGFEQVAVDKLPSCDPSAGARLSQDAALLNEVLQAASKQRYDGVRPRLARIEAALAAAPAEPHMVEQCDGAVLVHTDDMGMMVMMSATVKPAEGQKTLNIVQQPWPYPLLAFLAGATYVEDHEYEKAALVLGRGLQFSPMDPLLTSEAATNLTVLERYYEAIAVCDRTLKNLFLQPGDRARILRAKAHALGQLGRFDDGIAAYKASLKDEPGNAIALNGIKVLKARKKGAPAGQSELVNQTK